MRISVFRIKGLSIFRQTIVSLFFIVIISVSSFALESLIGYKVVAFILLLAVSVLAMLFDIVPVLLTAVFSALIWNFFFIPPVYTFHIGTPENALMFSMYFMVAFINAVLTFKIKDAEKKARDKEEKDKAIELYNTLLNSLSHELRTPISTIIGAIDTIRENENRLTADNKEQLLSEIEIAGLRLNRHVENLLNMSRLEAGVLKPKLDWCDINELIYSVINVHIKEAGRHTIMFNPNEKLPLYKVDRIFIEQVLQNLLHNALQYTPPGTAITIEALSQVPYCRIIVSDNGEGFPADKVNDVFDKFYRVSQSVTGGLGLGLSIARGFVEAHGGTIRIENQPAGGARFIIDLPVEMSPINDVKNE